MFPFSAFRARTGVSSPVTPSRPPAGGVKLLLTFARPAFTGRGRGGPHAMRGALWGRTPGLLQGRPGAPQAFPPGRPSSCGPFLRNGPDGRRAPLAKSASVHVVCVSPLLHFTLRDFALLTSLYFTSPHFTLPNEFDFSFVCFRSPLSERERAFLVPSRRHAPRPGE